MVNWTTSFDENTTTFTIYSTNANKSDNVLLKRKMTWQRSKQRYYEKS